MNILCLISKLEGCGANSVLIELNKWASANNHICDVITFSAKSLQNRGGLNADNTCINVIPNGLCSFWFENSNIKDRYDIIIIFSLPQYKLLKNEIINVNINFIFDYNIRYYKNKGAKILYMITDHNRYQVRNSALLHNLINFVDVVTVHSLHNDVAKYLRDTFTDKINLQAYSPNALSMDELKYRFWNKQGDFNKNMIFYLGRMSLWKCVKEVMMFAEFIRKRDNNLMLAMHGIEKSIAFSAFKQNEHTNNLHKNIGDSCKYNAFHFGRIKDYNKYLEVIQKDIKGAFIFDMYNKYELLPHTATANVVMTPTKLKAESYNKLIEYTQLEAIAVGAPVIMSKISGENTIGLNGKRLIDEDCGIIFWDTQNDLYSEKLYDTIVNMTRKKRNILREKAFEYFREYSKPNNIFAFLNKIVEK